MRPMSGWRGESLTLRQGGTAATVVYRWCIGRTNIDIDEDAVRVVMERYHLRSKRDAVNFALRSIAGEPLDIERARALRGAGWAGDLDDMRSARTG